MKTNQLLNEIEYLICDVGFLWRKRNNLLARELGMCVLDRRILIKLELSPGITQVELAERIEVEPQSLTRIIDRLEKKAWVERQTSPDDRRAKCLFLTPAVGPILIRIHKAMNEFRPLALEGVSAEDVKCIEEKLQIIKTNIVGHLG